tara:strand:- start:2702 stop:3703 length:1002 start_codon:yes stop_codon:yes gene_type:complete
VLHVLQKEVNKTKQALFLPPALLALIAVVGCSPDEVISVTLQASDANGKPVENADATIAFYQPDSTFNSQSGKTNAKGIFSYKAKSYDDIGYSIEKSGFYRSAGKIHPYRMDGSAAVLVDGQPIYEDQRVDIELKEVLTPIPLVAYANWELNIPERNVKLGYDVLAGDWVPPHGNGESIDIFFEYKSEYREEYDYSGSLQMTFPNEYDGFAEFESNFSYGSALKSEYRAPTSGYMSKKIWRFKRDRGYNQRDFDESVGYWLRLRTTVDEAGKIRAALYAKVYGDIQFGGIHEKAFLKFSAVYVNPEQNDTNLEFDPDRNLLGELKPKNRPRYP